MTFYSTKSFYYRYEGDYNRLNNDQNYNLRRPKPSYDYAHEVEYNGMSLEDIASDEITEEMCFSALHNDWKEMEFFPGEVLTDELALECFKASPRESHKTVASIIHAKDYTILKRIQNLI